jgi:hypothetical protein
VKLEGRSFLFCFFFFFCFAVKKEKGVEMCEERLCYAAEWKRDVVLVVAVGHINLMGFLTYIL